MEEQGLFRPSSDQIRTKSFYWVRAKANNSLDRPVTLSEAISVTGDARLRRWWGDDFAKWFKSCSAFDEELDALVQEMPYYLRDILDAATPQLSTKVNAIKVVAELAGLGKGTGKEGDSLPQTAEELKKLIEGKKHLLTKITGGKK